MHIYCQLVGDVYHALRMRISEGALAKVGVGLIEYVANRLKGSSAVHHFIREDAGRGERDEYRPIGSFMRVLSPRNTS